MSVHFSINASTLFNFRPPKEPKRIQFSLQFFSTFSYALTHNHNHVQLFMLPPTICIPCASDSALTPPDMLLVLSTTPQPDPINPVIVVYEKGH